MDEEESHVPEAEFFGVRVPEGKIVVVGVAETEPDAALETYHLTQACPPPPDHMTAVPVKQPNMALQEGWLRPCIALRVCQQLTKPLQQHLRACCLALRHSS